MCILWSKNVCLIKIEFLCNKKRNWIWIFMYLYFISRSWCPDRTLSQARKYIASSLDEKYTEPVILNLEKTWEESDTRTPLICFLSMGADPTIQIDSLARKLRLGRKIVNRYVESFNIEKSNVRNFTFFFLKSIFKIHLYHHYCSCCLRDNVILNKI